MTQRAREEGIKKKGREGKRGDSAGAPQMEVKKEWEIRVDALPDANKVTGARLVEVGEIAPRHRRLADRPRGKEHELRFEDRVEGNGARKRLRTGRGKGTGQVRGYSFIHPTRHIPE